MKRLIWLVAAGAMITTVSPAFAEEEAASTLCASTQCGENEKLVSFTDGNRETCTCQATGEDMVVTVPEEADSPGAHDAGWTGGEAVGPEGGATNGGGQGWGDGA